MPEAVSYPGPNSPPLIADNALGIHLDPGSDDNQFFDNTLTGNDTNLLDEGLGNCGGGNLPEIFGDC